MLTRLRDRQEWAFFRVLPRANRTLTAVWWTLIVLRGLLPATLGVSLGLLVGAVQRDDPLVTPLLVVGTAFVVMQLLAPLHALVGANLGEQLSCWLHDRLLVATTNPRGIAHLESRELTDKLTSARDFDLGMAGPPMTLSVGFISGGLVEAVAGLAQAAVLGAYRWWAPLVIGGAWASTHWLLRESSSWDRNAGEVLAAQRRSEYTYRMAVEASAAKEIRVFGLSDWVVDQFAANRRRLVDLKWKANRLRQRPLSRAIAVLLVANGLVLWYLARDAVEGTVSTAEVVVFAQAIVGASALAFGGLNWALPPAAHAAATVLELESTMGVAGRLESGDRPADGLPAAQIRLRNVGFAYPTESRPVLDGLDLTIEAGTSLAIVGLNGAGKTTLVKLLCRLYDPTSGTIEVDGVDLRCLDLESWRSRVTTVFQDFVRYELPLRDNVAPLGAPDDVIEAALADADAADIAALGTVMARGYDGGTDLSGGQWQRVAVARALCAVRQGAGVVILDEPTAQLDVRTEARVFGRILDATRGRTTILISHRFATVRRADRICVLDGGRVVELGTHEALMAADGPYRRMFDMQASRFDEEADDVVRS
ncbi:ABC transporter ATP-binding protein [Micromonospora echinospora]